MNNELIKLIESTILIPIEQTTMLGNVYHIALTSQTYGELSKLVEQEKENPVKESSKEIDVTRPLRLRNGSEYCFIGIAKNGNLLGEQKDATSSIWILIGHDRSGWHSNGKSGFDLVYADEKKKLTGFVNIYKDANIMESHIWPLESDADRAGMLAGSRFITTIDLSQYNIEYEDKV
jgi:hypothetical protein